MFKPLHFVFVLIIFLSPVVIGKDLLLRSAFVIWNVGQGQWITLMGDKTCHHFDMGGEKNPLSRVLRVCTEKENRIYLSHWDWDHVSFALKARQVLKRACMALPPVGRSSAYKMKILAAYSACGDSSEFVQELTRFHDLDFSENSRKKTNELSHVLLAARGKFLIPGDSTSSQEKIWSYSPNVARAKILVLGHHGSKTSTSEVLISRLANLKIAVSSARSSRYGHPHFEVVERLRKHRIPLLRTEDWGNIWFLE